MDYQEKVRYLKSYEQMHYRLEFICSQIEKIKSPGHHGDGNGPVKTINDYLDEKVEVMEKMSEIEDRIDNVVNTGERYVLAYRFLHFKKLEEVAEIMHYSLAMIKIYYKNGINSLF